MINSSHIYIILGSLILSAFFSGMEIAFVSANKLRIALDKKQGIFPSKIISIFSRHPGQYIATMLVGNNIALVVYGLIMSKNLEPIIALKIHSAPAVLLIQTVISTLIILVTAEFLPKTLFRLNPNLALNVLSIPLFLFYALFYPATWVVLKLSNLLFKVVLKAKPSVHKPSVFGKIDLENLVNGVNIESDEDDNTPELKLLQNALDFSDLKLRDCMIPRTEIIALDKSCKITDLQEKFVETGLSKILIYEESIDNIIGYVSSKELFKYPKDINSIMVKLQVYPETMKANKLLKKFIQEHKSIAIIVDEFGGTSGMLTIEDIIEEIFGEIEDEHDLNALVEKTISEDEYVFSGRLEIDTLNEKYCLNIPESEDYDTLAGFIIYYNENIPKIQETIIIDKFEVKILQMDNTRLELVKLKRL